jgi:hypothetical protein
MLNGNKLCDLALLRSLDSRGEALVDEWQHTSAGDRSAHKSVEFFVTADGELQMAWRYALDTQILRRVACTNKSVPFNH